MAINFSPETGLSADDGAKVRNDIAQYWKKAFKKDANTPELNTEPETPAGQLIDGEAALVIEKDNAILYLANMFNPQTSSGIFQDALGKIYFINRHIAQSTLVTCTCKGLPGTVIPVNSIVEDINGKQFISTQAATIAENREINISFACTESGAVEVRANTVKKIITVIPGWDSVINANAGIIGRSRETETEFEDRRFDSVAKNSHGLAESIEGSIYNLSDVIACKVANNRNSATVEMLGVQVPGHSIYLSVYGGNDDEIGQVIYRKINAGCGTAGNTAVTVTDTATNTTETYFYTKAVETNLYVKIYINPDALYDASTIKQSIINNIYGVTNDFTRLKMGDTMYASRIYQSVIDAGLNDFINIQVSKDNINFAYKTDFKLNEMPLITADNITFTENAGAEDG